MPRIESSRGTKRTRSNFSNSACKLARYSDGTGEVQHSNTRTRGRAAARRALFGRSISETSSAVGMSQVVVILDSQEESQAGTKRLAEQVVVILDSSQEAPRSGAKGLAETTGAKRLSSQAVVDLTKEDGVPIPRKRARASTSEAVLIDLTLEEDALTAQLNAWNAAGAIDLTGDEEARGGVGPAP